MRKILLFLLLIISIKIQAQTKQLPNISVDLFAYDKADYTLERLVKYYKLKINYDADRLKAYQLSADWKQEPLENVIRYICRKTNSIYYVSEDGTINIVNEKEFVPVQADTPQNKYSGTPVKKNITVSGNIQDKQTGEAIPFATVYIRGTTNGSTTNSNGFFTINNVGNDTSCIVCTYIGYQTNYFFLNPDTDLQHIKLEMLSSSYTLSAITITGERAEVMQVRRQDISVVRMSPKKLQQLPNLGESDIMRSFQLMPGVSAANESSSNLYVRGGTPDQNLVLYDGFTVYQVDHLYGFYSAFNSNAIKDVQLYKGGFESKFGGRLSSVTEITGKDGNQNKFNLGCELSMLSANIFTEVPIGKKITFIAAARRSYQGPLYKKFFKHFQTENNTSSAPSGGGPEGASLATTVKSYFYDLNSKITFRPTENDIISLSFFNGSDKLDNGFKMETPSFLASQGINLNFSISDLTNYGNTGTSLKWGRKWNQKIYSNTLLTYSHYYSKRDRSNDGTVTDASGVETTFKQGTLENNNLSDYSFKTDFEWNLFKNHKIGFGAFSTYYDIAYKYSQNDTSSIINKQNYGLLTGVYMQDNMNFLNTKLTVTPGLRISYFDVTKKPYFEPRLASTYSLTEKVTVKAVWGKFYQFANRVTREDILSGSRDFWILSNNTNIPVSSANHYMAGLSYETASYLFSAEGYYKTLTNLSEYSLRISAGGPQQGISYSENFYNGTGTAKGIEFLAQKKSGKFNGWVSYTLGETMNHFAVYSAEDYPANQDVTHEFKAVALYKWKRFDFSATWIYATGKPYTAPSGAYTVTLLDHTTQDYFTTTSKNSLKLPAYHRLDFAVNYRFINSSDNEIGYIGFSLFNVYNRTNIWYKQYEIVSGQIIETNVNYLGITPNITLSLRLR